VYIPFQNMVHIFTPIQLELKVFFYCDVGSLIIAFLMSDKIIMKVRLTLELLSWVGEATLSPFHF